MATQECGRKLRSYLRASLIRRHRTSSRVADNWLQVSEQESRPNTDAHPLLGHGYRVSRQLISINGSLRKLNDQVDRFWPRPTTGVGRLCQHSSSASQGMWLEENRSAARGWSRNSPSRRSERPLVGSKNLCGADMNLSRIFPNNCLEGDQYLRFEQLTQAECLVAS